LDFAHVEQLSRKFERQGKILFHLSSVLLQLLGMSHLELFNLLLVFFLGFRENVVPVLVEFLVLFDVGLLDVFLSLLVCEHKLLVLHVKLLLLQLEDAVLCHFGLWKKQVTQSIH